MKINKLKEERNENRRKKKNLNSQNLSKLFRIHWNDFLRTSVYWQVTWLVTKEATCIRPRVNLRKSINARNAIAQMVVCIRKESLSFEVIEILRRAFHRLRSSFLRLTSLKERNKKTLIRYINYFNETLNYKRVYFLKNIRNTHHNVNFSILLYHTFIFQHIDICTFIYNIAIIYM